MSGRSSTFTTNLTHADVTPKSIFHNRRQLIKAAGALSLAPFAMGVNSIAAPRNDKYSTDAEPNSFEDISTYNNFYEFGTSKSDPARYADALTTSPWSVKVDGLCNKPGDYSVDDIKSRQIIEERIYRFRCVEAWSMVVPWVGFSLADMLKQFEPQPGAKYVYFETLVRPSEMRGQRGGGFVDWPYREGLRMDEAMHPLSFMATGLYDEDLPNQNGAPMRLVVPWKYGFKSIKSIVRISFMAEQPINTWNAISANEYGFYANVNPDVPHPRWSQASERVLGAGLFGSRQPTQMFNGYGDEVASLYAGMDLTKNF